MPLNRPVHFYEESADVIHSFFIPVFLFKLDVVPGLHNNFILTPNRTGTFQGKCAELCGQNHADMRARVPKWRTAGRLRDNSRSMRNLYLGPLRTIIPWQWDWFD